MHFIEKPETAFFFASVFSGLLVLIGGAFLYIKQFNKLRADEPFLFKTTRKSFIVLIALIVTFIGGYSAIIAEKALHYQIDFNSIIGPVLFLGSLFVLATAYLTVSMFRRQLKSRKILRRQAYHDYMTRLPNRRMFTEELERTIAESKKTDELFTVIFLDLLNFKKVNDSFGHYFGDKILIKVSKRLLMSCGKNALVSRIGGDDFTILFKGLNPHQSIKKLETVRHELLQPFKIDDIRFSLDASYGVYTSIRKENIGPNEIINRANIAMRRSKKRGKNVLTIYTKAMNTPTYDILQFESNFKTAIKQDQFNLVYQPQFNIQNGITLSGFEALVRWHHPERGMISPAEFIPQAEETGLIVDLDRLVLKKACSMWSSCIADRGPCKGIHLSVNFSAKHITEPAMLKETEEIITKFGIPAETLHIELTESAFIGNPELAAIKLRALNEFGVHCAIDDFGTGYSSLAYLSNFPSQSLKIDMSFVQGIETDTNKRKLIESIIKLTHGLNMSAIAEGVETEEQLQILIELGCDVVQGFYLGKPLSEQEAKDLMITSEKAPV
ncbi:putative bifunctional diguanylate cyclase/phosphodiesterase [Maridesulfovibrio sp.]|uniref:putative bifunctional diguanylate cyclase/phosphodiesterase n=1 Tax=Maridesulfovibrio sp. TaxID=2795000 RepID=UPI0039EDF7CF